MHAFIAHRLAGPRQTARLGLHRPPPKTRRLAGFFGEIERLRVGECGDHFLEW